MICISRESCGDLCFLSSFFLGNVSYQSTNEQAQGLVSKRDFINLTTRRVIDGVTLLAAQACLYPQLPPTDK